ncbi:MAG: cupin domain-containing protein [Gammaproteobacteria bacterium]|nr:cupin domain-containing protein [Gammaproteobacteria bacterium]
MNINPKLAVVFLMIAVTTGVIAATHEQKAVLPAKIDKSDAAGMIFKRDDMSAITHEDGHKTEDVTTMISSDGKFGTGMYRSGKTRSEINEPYGVDEFMYFLKGSVTLTSSDGSVMTVHAGEAVTIPKEWTGVWDTDGYEKIWIIYSEDGSGL